MKTPVALALALALALTASTIAAATPAHQFCGIGHGYEPGTQQYESCVREHNGGWYDPAEHQRQYEERKALEGQIQRERNRANDRDLGMEYLEHKLRNRSRTVCTGAGNQVVCTTQ